MSPEALKALSLLDEMKGAKLKGHSAVNKIYSAACRDYDDWRKENGKALRTSQLKQLGGYCTVCMCGYDEYDRRISIDHLDPKRIYLHKAVDPSNFLIMCNECNSQKGSKEFPEWRKALRPTYRQSLDESITLIHGKTKLAQLIG